MMYLHYCSNCKRIHMLNGHKMVCPKCEARLIELKISYLDYVDMSREERELLLQDCQNRELLAKMSANYRMYKYSKWYKQLCGSGAPSKSGRARRLPKDAFNELQTDHL